MSAGPLVVLGDTLLDVDLEGTSQRLCPDAPAPVVDLQWCRYRPGGAGLAALLAARSGYEVVLVTALGEDAPARRLARLLAPSVMVEALPLHGNTVRKTRVTVGGRVVLRLDSGDGRAAAGGGRRAAEALREAGAVLVSDYGRGITAHPGLRAALAGVAGWVPIVWDPHPRGAAPVPGAVLATPNEAEAALFAGHAGGVPGAGPAADAALLREVWAAGAVAVTAGQRGARLCTASGSGVVPVPPDVVVADRANSCGAGDSFAAAAATALLGGDTVADAVRAAVRSAAEFVAAGAAGALAVATAPDVRPATGCAAVDRVADGVVVATGGCFDLLHPGHVSLLRRARALGDALVVCVNSDESVRRLKGPGRPVMPVADRVRMVEALGVVDAVVVFAESSPAAALERLRPDIWVKGADYTDRELPEAAVVSRYGGRVVLVPLAEHHSTTRLITAIHENRADGDGERDDKRSGAACARWATS